MGGTAVCFSGSLVGRADHVQLRGAELCATSQRRMVEALDARATVFAVVNPCAPPTQCKWGPTGCREYSIDTGCSDVKSWATANHVEHLHIYNKDDNAVPGNGCEGALPPPRSRFFHQFWGWKQCLSLIDAVERERKQRFDVIVKTRPDLCFASSPQGETARSLLAHQRLDRPGFASRGAPATSSRSGRLDQVLRESNGGVAVSKGKPHPLACSDSFAVVPRKHVEAYLSTVDQYLQCSPNSTWEPFIGEVYRQSFGGPYLPGEVVLGKQLTEHNIPWKTSATLAQLMHHRKFRKFRPLQPVVETNRLRANQSALIKAVLPRGDSKNKILEHRIPRKP